MWLLLTFLVILIEGKSSFKKEKYFATIVDVLIEIRALIECK